MKYKVGDKVWILSREALKILNEQCKVTVDPSIYEIAGTIRTITKVYEGGFYLVSDYPIALSWKAFAEPLEEREAIDASETKKQVKEDVAKNYIKAIIEEQERINEEMNKKEQYGPTCSEMFEAAKLHREKQSFTKAEIFGDVIFYPADSGARLELIRNKGYEFRDENGNVIEAEKIVLDKKKPKWPKTYKECCKILNLPVRDLDILDNMLDTTEIIYNKNLDRLLNSFRKLLICRDAYWKIAGEEMGLGKPWSINPHIPCHYMVHLRPEMELKKLCGCLNGPAILAFPTKEMRDAFYENFRELIEDCKELL